MRTAFGFDYGTREVLKLKKNMPIHFCAISSCISFFWAVLTVSAVLDKFYVLAIMALFAVLIVLAVLPVLAVLACLYWLY
jgi:hypothetical protein